LVIKHPKNIIFLRSDPEFSPNVLVTVILSFLKRESERERFLLFVPMRNYVPTRTFLDVLDSSALQPFIFVTLNGQERLHERYMKADLCRKSPSQVKVMTLTFLKKPKKV
jgi:hypothetical protein